MESDQLMEGERKPVPSDYSSTYKAGQQAPKFTQKTVIGEVRNWKRFSWLEWTFIVVATISVLGVLTMSIERFVFFESSFKNITKANSTAQLYSCDKWTCTNDFIFTVVLVLNLVFCAVYVVDGLLRERMFELVGYSVAVVIIMLYVIANYGVKSQGDYRLIRLVIVLIGGPVNIVLSSIVSYKMGYFIFTTVGSNAALIRAYKIRSFFLTLQYFLLQVMANLLALSWSQEGQFLLLSEKIIVSLLLVHCFVVVLLGWTAVMFENRWLVPVWYLTLAPYYAYFVYKITNVSVNFTRRYKTKVVIYDKDSHAVNADFQYIGAALIGACLLGLLVLASLYTFMALTHRNFKKGLKEKVPPSTEIWQSLYHRSRARMSLRRQVSSPLV